MANQGVIVNVIGCSCVTVDLIGARIYQDYRSFLNEMLPYLGPWTFYPHTIVSSVHVNCFEYSPVNLAELICAK